MDMLKNQILTISAMQGGKDGNTIMNAIYGIMLLSIIEQVFKYLPIIGAFFKKYSEEYIKRRYGSMNIVHSIGNIKKELTGSIILERSYLDKDSGQNSELVESLLEYVAKLPNIKFLKYRTRFFVSHKEEFQIDNNVFGRCVDYVQSVESGELEKITIQVYSYTMDIVELRAFLNKIHKNYVIAKKNQLGDQTYFFDHIANQNNNIPMVRFDMTPFNTNKSLKTIYGSYMSNVLKRINFFIKNRDWYVKKGIPHTLGLLLHGPPGCGKTSLIKAIANDTHRHIVNIQLNKDVTQTQLKSLFFNEEVLVFNKKTGQNELFLIPLEQRIYVMEDVDAISDILYSRDIIKAQKDIEEKVRQEAYEVAKREAAKKGYAAPPPPQDIKDGNKEQITLAFILNLLDGILETPGRIIILTTNHPEKLDSALVRPGRIDLNIHFNRCSRDTIVELVSKFYETIDESSKEWCDFLSELGKLDEFMLTPAEVNKIIFNHYSEPNLAFNEIISDIRENMKKCKKEEVQVANNTNNSEVVAEGEEKVAVAEATEAETKETKKSNEMGKFYLTTDKQFIQIFGSGIVDFLNYLNEKMYLVEDTLLLDSKALKHIQSTYATINVKKMMIENMIDTNRKIVLKSSDVMYKIHEDTNGKFIYLDKETLDFLDKPKDEPVIIDSDVSGAGDNDDTQVHNEVLYKKTRPTTSIDDIPTTSIGDMLPNLPTGDRMLRRPPQVDKMVPIRPPPMEPWNPSVGPVVSVPVPACFSSSFSSIGFEPVNGSGSGEASSSLDDFFKPII